MCLNQRGAGRIALCDSKIKMYVYVAKKTGKYIKPPVNIDFGIKEDILPAAEVPDFSNIVVPTLYKPANALDVLEFLGYKTERMTKAKESLLICDKCGVTFKNFKRLSCHLREQHLLYDCFECPERLGGKDVAKHYKTAHDIDTRVDTLSCPLCAKIGEEFVSTYHRIPVHIANKHFPAVHCEYCFGVFENQQNLAHHKRKRHERLPCPASNCEETTGSEKTMRDLINLS